MSDRYDAEEGPETAAYAEERIEAADGPVEASVVVSAEAPDAESAARVAEALAAANRTVVHRVFAGPDEGPDDGSGGLSAAGAAEQSDFESSGQESGGASRPMDWDGGDG